MSSSEGGFDLSRGPTPTLTPPVSPLKPTPAPILNPSPTFLRTSASSSSLNTEPARSRSDDDEMRSTGSKPLQSITSNQLPRPSSSSSLSFQQGQQHPSPSIVSSSSSLQPPSTPISSRTPPLNGFKTSPYLAHYLTRKPVLAGLGGASTTNLEGTPPSLAPPRSSLSSRSSATASAGWQGLGDVAAVSYGDPTPTGPKVKFVKQYMLGDVLGEGAYSKVREGLDTVTLKRVAVKKIKQMKLRRMPNAEAAVKKEISILRSLSSHPNVVSLVEVIRDTEKDVMYIVLELVDGASVQSILNYAPGGRLPLVQARSYFSQLIDGLQSIHAQGVIHRDIKPANLMVSKEGYLKLTDFGVADALDRYAQSDTVTKSSGSPAFQPPEAALGVETAFSGAKVDIWAAGVTLFVMVTGTFPFSGSNIFLLFEAIGSGEYTVPPDVDPCVADLLHGCLRKDPAERFTIEQIKAHPWLSGVDDSAATTRATSVPPSMATLKKRRPSANNTPTLGARTEAVSLTPSSSSSSSRSSMTMSSTPPVGTTEVPVGRRRSPFRFMRLATGKSKPPPKPPLPPDAVSSGVSASRAPSSRSSQASSRSTVSSTSSASSSSSSSVAAHLSFQDSYVLPWTDPFTGDPSGFESSLLPYLSLLHAKSVVLESPGSGRTSSVTTSSRSPPPPAAHSSKSEASSACGWIFSCLPSVCNIM